MSTGPAGVEGGEALLRKPEGGGQEEAESLLRPAVETAQQKKARSLELRATIVLARLLRDRGRSDEAVSVLSPVFGAFKEGFGTRDLQDAKALLDELA
jgi:predicted ATPase